MGLQTAVVIVPPYEIQAFAVPLRQRYQPRTWIHIPAHITLLFPFVPPEEIDVATRRLVTAAREARPFPVALDHYGRFERAVFLEPADPAPLSLLHQRLAAAFPDFPVYAGEHGTELHPHLTIAELDDTVQAADLSLPAPPEMTFLVDRLFVYLGDPEVSVPFVPRSMVFLGAGG
jgi:2'-5' RNA ligase